GVAGDRGRVVVSDEQDGGLPAGELSDDVAQAARNSLEVTAGEKLDQSRRRHPLRRRPGRARPEGQLELRELVGVATVKGRAGLDACTWAEGRRGELSHEKCGAEQAFQPEPRRTRTATPPSQAVRSAPVRRS